MRIPDFLHTPTLCLACLTKLLQHLVGTKNGVGRQSEGFNSYFRFYLLCDLA